jgi:anthranilate/para-aminobenzoate synthase component I
MTGAPKLRTMEIIDDIEREARCASSGAYRCKLAWRMSARR